MILSDTEIFRAIAKGQVKFENANLHDWQFQSVSVDLRLGDVGPGRSSRSQSGDDPREWLLRPRAFVLASTLEVVTIGPALCGFVAGKSSVARRGIQVEAAGLVDPGFSGQLTLEVVNFTRDSVMLTEFEPICQIYFMRVDGPVARPYDTPGLRSRYQHQRGPTPARTHPPEETP